MNTRDSKIDRAANVVKRTNSISVNPAIDITNGVIELVQLPSAIRLLGAAGYCSALAGAVSADVRFSAATGRLTPGILAIDAVPEKFKLITNTIVALFAGVVKTKAPTTANVFSAAHVITANKAGSILVQIDSAGVVSTKVIAATQAFPTVLAAVAALPAADAGKLAVGHIDILNNALDWVANTDDMTNGSDVTTAAFTNLGVRTPLAAAIAYAAGDEVPGTVNETYEDAEADEYLAVITTSNHTGVLTDGRLHLHYRARPYRGD